ANFTLLAVTIAVVAVLLLLTYRSPILWLVPLAVVALADGAAGAVTSTLGEQLSLAFDAGVISVLVFGAGTNYALLLISRYREELHRRSDHRAALATAWVRTAPAIIASNVTVVLALMTLLAAVMPATRGLGIAAAAGLLIALLAVLFPLTSLLAVVGRGVFWPFVPRPESPARAATRRDDAEHGPFAAVARTVTGRPAVAAIGSVLLMAVLATGLLGTRVGRCRERSVGARGGGDGTGQGGLPGGAAARGGGAGPARGGGAGGPGAGGGGGEGRKTRGGGRAERLQGAMMEIQQVGVPRKH